MNNIYIPAENEIESALLIMRSADIAIERAFAEEQGESADYVCSPGWHMEWTDRA